VALAVWLAAGTACYSAEGADRLGPEPQVYQATVDRAIQFLAKQQAPDGSLSGQMGIGATALATLGLLRQGRGVGDPQVSKGLKYLEEFVQESGGIHAPGTFISNYETCVAIVCLQQANADHRYDKVIRQAEAFVRGVQWGEAKGREKSDIFYGGAGYGGKSRPDLSNTAFLIETLRACGAGPNDPAVQKALVFVSRCQNLESEHNTTQFAAKVNDGGFYYTCVVEQGKAQTTPEGGLRSYGSMGYSGLKSMIYAGLTRDDPRVKAAVTWIRKHYDVKSNPGQGDAGLYYYYHTFAKALDVLGEDRIEDAAGVKHDWRRELTEELARRQQADGSWVNTNTRWGEGDANLATSFAVLALSYCRPGDKAAGK
jgi:squalene-hopene/tetraprenyl-beta-curcumene cyclase